MNSKRLLGLFLFILCACTSFAQGAEVTVVLDEKFDAFTEGTVDAPASTDISSYSSGKLSKTLSGWSGSKVYEAGGALMLADGGRLQTKNQDTSTNGRNVRISVDVKCRDNYGGGVKISLGYSFSETVYLYDDEWHTVSVITDKGTVSGYIKIEPTLSVSGIIIDNLKVETSEGFVAAPEARQPTSATATSFLASWKSVSGATAYLLDVYTKNGETKDYLLKDEEVTTTSKSVSGLVEGKTYYYTVRAKKGENVSDYSNEIEVVEIITSIDTPKGLAATNVTAAGFTANWEAVVKAAKYEVMLFKTENFTATTEKNILDEDFSKVTLGSLTGVVEYGKSQEYLDAYTAVPGWYGVAHCFAAGYMGIAPFSTPGTITTPALDLSNNGKCKLTINMAEGAYGTYYDGYEVTINLYNGNEEIPAETKKVTLEKGFKEYTIDFTAGTAESYIEISYGGSNKLFIDYMSVSTTLNAGDKYTSLVETREVEGDKTSADFSVTLDENTTYSYQVKAYARTVVGGEIDYLVSELSAPVEVKLEGTGINEVNNGADSTSLRVTDGGVVVTLDGKAVINVYALNGQLLQSVRGVNGENSVSLAAGTAIVKVGGKAYKVVIR